MLRTMTDYIQHLRLLWLAINDKCDMNKVYKKDKGASSQKFSETIIDHYKSAIRNRKIIYELMTSISTIRVIVWK